MKEWNRADGEQCVARVDPTVFSTFDCFIDSENLERNTSSQVSLGTTCVSKNLSIAIFYE